MKVFIALCLFGLALGAPQLDQRLQQVEEEIYSSPDPYNFHLEVSDDETTNYQARQESQDENGNVQGEYSWVGADGIRYITSYSASPETGFLANTVKEQTDIIVIVPQPKPEFQERI